MQKFVNLVDLVKSFPTSIPTSIHLQRLVSIQPRTSLSKFANKCPKVEKNIIIHIGSVTEIDLALAGGRVPMATLSGDRMRLSNAKAQTWHQRLHATWTKATWLVS